MARHFRHILPILGLLAALPLRVWGAVDTPPDSLRSREPFDFSIRTNLLWAATSTPNLALDFALGEHFSLGINAGVKPWPRWTAWDWDAQNPAKWRHLTIVPQARWWPRRVFDGWFIGADLIYSHFNVGSVRFPFGLYPAVRDQRLQGDLYGAGLFAGHSWWIGEHWRIEVEAGVGAAYSRADRYECEHCGARIGTQSGPVIIPKLGVNLAWDLRSRTRKRQEILDVIQQIETPPVQPDAPEPDEEQQPVPDTPEPTPPRQDTIVPPAPVHPLLAHPVVRNASEYRPYTPDRVLRKEEGALVVYFPFDSAQILREYDDRGSRYDNGSTLDEILRITQLILAEPGCSIRTIQLVGFSSIDGSRWHNEALSLARAKALQAYIQAHLDVPDGLFDTVGAGEGWTELRDILEDLHADTDAATAAGLSADDLDRILQVFDTVADPSQRESELRRLAGGRIWRALFGAGLRDQRNAGFVRVYVDFDDKEK